MEQGKVCKKCNEWKLYIEFHKHNRMKDGHVNQCKKCSYTPKRKPIERTSEGKMCRICNEFKKFDEFHRKSDNKDGLQNQCKSCDKQTSKRYQQENKEKIATQRKQYRKDNIEYFKNYNKLYHQENKELILQQKKKYRQENKDIIAEKLKQYYQENKETLLYQKKLYYQTDKGRENIYKNILKRRSNKNNVSFTPFQRVELLERDNYTCQYCGITVHDRSTGDWNTPDKAEIDHIIPISKGGNSEPSNLQILCRTCNRSKSDKIECVEQSKEGVGIC